MSIAAEYFFKLGERNCCVVRSNTLIKRTYNLGMAQGYPWMTYTGADRTTGGGTICPASYALPDKSGSRYLYSTGPWWVDGNHAHPGYGYLSLVFLCLLRPDKLQNIMFFDPNLCYPNMREINIRGKIRGHNVDLKGANLLFWFQCYSERIDKNFNYALIGQPLNDKLLDEKINDFDLNIDVRNTQDWVCLGSCVEKSHLYGELEIGKLDATKPVNMGFILTPMDVKPVWPDECDLSSPMNLKTESLWPIDVNFLPTGTIAIYDLEIDYSSHYKIVEVTP